MATATLDDFMALNDQLAALAEAGVPVELGLDGWGGHSAASLEKINAAVARRVSQGASLAEAVDGDRQSVTPLYRYLMQLGLRSERLSASLDGSSQLAESIDDARHVATFSLLYPLIVACLAYVGFVAFCLLLVPILHSMYQSMRIREGSTLLALEALRRTLPFWVAIPPLALVLVIGSQRLKFPAKFSRGRAANLLAWLPGLSRALSEQRSANFAESLATLLDGGAPVEEALTIAAGAWDDAAIEGATRAVAASQVGGASPSGGRLAARYRPFLRWALLDSEPTIGRAQALKIAAEIYRESARRRVERWRMVAPLALCVVLGGGVTLLYGLALFVPLVDMLKGLAS